MPLDMELRESVTRDNIPENRIAFEFAIKKYAQDYPAQLLK